LEARPLNCRSVAVVLTLLGLLAPALLGVSQPQGSERTVRAIAADGRISKQRLATVESLATQGVQRLKKWFPGTPQRLITFVLHSDASSLGKSQRESLQPGVPGFALLQRDQIHLILHEIKVDPPNDLRTTVDHELVHILLDQYVGKNGLSVPRWLHEGLAQVLSGSMYLDIQEEQLAYRVKHRTYLPFSSLRESFPVHDKDQLALAYGQSASFVAFLRGKVGLEPLIEAARECSKESPFYRVVSKRLTRGLTLFELEWCDYIEDSGAGFRLILRNYFMLLVVAAGPLLALAVARRRNRELVVKRRMASQERAEEMQAQLLAEAAALSELEACDDADEDREP
jgi:hypothetical protein